MQKESKTTKAVITAISIRIAHPKKDSLIGYFDLTRELESDPRIRSISPYTKRLFVHHFRISSMEEMDETFRAWIQEAYGVGQGDHLKKTE